MTEPKKIRVTDHSNVPLDSIQIETKYCITDEQRSNQIRMAVARNLPTIYPGPVIDEPIALACFGPSLVHNLDKLREFKTIISMSGSHAVLVDNGIVPKWHVECDPRPHKADFLRGKAHPDTEFLISSCCHPEVFEILEGHKLKVWHMYGNEVLNDIPLIYPRGAWLLTGGSNVGLRSLVVARFLGYRNIHVFGMDCSFESEGGATHAGYHPNSTKYRLRVTVEDREFITSAVFLEYARQFFTEMEKLPDVTATLHGDGMLQAMVNEKAKLPPEQPKIRKDGVLLAMAAKETISDQYLELNKKLHKDRPDYGTSGAKRVEAILKLKECCKAESILDYGCGKGLLGAALPFPIWEYDPAIPGKDIAPRSADLVICSDVLEHVEPEYLDSVIGDLRRVTKKMLYAVIHTGPAQKTLADGRNAHLIQKPVEWWAEKLSRVFKLGAPVVGGNGVELHFIGEPIPDHILPTVRSMSTKPTALSNDESLPSRNVVAVIPTASTTIERNGTQVTFHTPNDITRWRANTLFTKEPITIEWIDSFQPGEIFYDVGANVGGYTVWACKHRQVKAYAFEPEHSNYDLLSGNIELNHCEAIAARMAISDETKEDYLYVSSKEPGNSCNTFGEDLDPFLRPRKSEKQICTSASLDRLVEENGFPMPHHIKIDVDGFEYKVINGMREILQGRHLKSLLVEVNTSLQQHRGMIKTLQLLGWDYDERQAKQALRTEGPFTGCGEYLFTRPMFEEVKLVGELEQYILERIAAVTVHPTPYPFMYVTQFLPPNFYEDLVYENMPLAQDYVSLEQARGTKGYPERYVFSPKGKPWIELEDALRSGRVRKALCDKFGVTGTTDEVLLIRDLPGHKIGPHTDTPAKVISALLYLPKDDRLKKHGTSIYTPIDPAFRDQLGRHHPFALFHKYATLKFIPNAVFIFAKTDNSFHGVEPFDGDGVRDIYLYDIRK